jgi:hypothetical protein
MGEQDPDLHLPQGIRTARQIAARLRLVLGQYDEKIFCHEGLVETSTAADIVANAKFWDQEQPVVAGRLLDEIMIFVRRTQGRKHAAEAERACNNYITYCLKIYSAICESYQKHCDDKMLRASNRSSTPKRQSKEVLDAAIDAGLWLRFGCSPLERKRAVKNYRLIKLHLDAFDLDAFSPSRHPLPTWDSVTGELTFNGVVVARFPPKATSRREVLGAFQMLQWKSELRIDEIPFNGHTRASDMVQGINESVAKQCGVSPPLKFGQRTDDGRLVLFWTPYTKASTGKS